MSTEIKETTNKLVSGPQLLVLLWDEESRPSLQWLRVHTGRDIPATRVGRLYFYNPPKVKEALGM